MRDVHCLDAESVKYARIRRRFQDAFENAKTADAELQFGLSKRNKGRAPLLARVRELKLEADKDETERLRVDAERERQERTDRELQEKQGAHDARAQLAAAQLATHRQRSVWFWQKQHADAKAFAEHQARTQEEAAAKAALVQQDAEQLEQTEPDDVRRPDVETSSSSPLGVFGTRLSPGEWHSAVDGGHRVGLGRLARPLLPQRTVLGLDDLT